MSIMEIAEKFCSFEISLLRAMKECKKLGYTKQERNKIYRGWIQWLEVLTSQFSNTWDNPK